MLRSELNISIASVLRQFDIDADPVETVNFPAAHCVQGAEPFVLQKPSGQRVQLELLVEPAALDVP